MKEVEELCPSYRRSVFAKERKAETSSPASKGNQCIRKMKINRTYLRHHGQINNQPKAKLNESHDRGDSSQ